MSGADDLRTAIADAVRAEYDVMGLAEADNVLAVLGDPVRRLALLELVGDVREVYVADDMMADKLVSGTMLYKRRDRGDKSLTSYLLVRPRGGAADG